MTRRDSATHAVAERAYSPRADPAGGLSRGGWLWIAGVTLAAAAAIVPLLARLTLEPRQLLLFTALAVGAALGSFLIVSTEPNHGFNTALVFISAGVLLLPPELVALMGIAHVVPQLVRRDFPWYGQLFNAANYTLNALAASAAAYAGHALLDGLSHALHSAVAIAAACLVLVGSNHLLLAIALRVARGRSFRESGLFSWRSISTELLLASLGATVAVVALDNIYLAPLVLAPFVLVNRSFRLLELLARSERRFRAVYESTAVGIRLSDANGRMVASNAAFGQIVGADPDQLVGTAIDVFVHEEDAPAHARQFRELVAGNHDSHVIEQRFVRADGSEGWARLTESLVRDADGAADFVVGMVQDITDARRLGERLNQAQKMEAVGRLAGGVAHDFNNLLTAIDASCRFLLSSLDAGERVSRADIEAISQAAAKAGALTSRLLAFGRRQMRQPRLLDLNAIVRETYDLLERTLGRDVTLALELEPSLRPITADPTQIEQVIVNLALNAADAMAGGGVVTIRTATVGDGRRVLLSVRDTGSGMDAATRARIFEPFFTTKDEKGTGLGLASVYAIVDQTGGDIHVESDPGLGTTMCVYLPTSDAAMPLARTTGCRPDGRATVLLVDDEDLVRSAARRLLAAHGYVVLEAFNGIDALGVASAHEHAIDVLVTDVAMPRIDGLELARRLAASHSDAAVVYMSGYTDEPISALAADGENVRFVHKPFTEQTLLEAVRGALGRDAEDERIAVGARSGR